MSGHTPGPWFLEEIDSDTGNFKHLVPAAELDGEVISLLTVVEHNGQQFAAVYSKHDARLIEAAPDCLVALKIVRGKHGCGALTLPAADLERVDAAILKATGGAS